MLPDSLRKILPSESFCATAVSTGNARLPTAALDQEAANAHAAVKGTGIRHRVKNDLTREILCRRASFTELTVSEIRLESANSVRMVEGPRLAGLPDSWGMSGGSTHRTTFVILSPTRSAAANLTKDLRQSHNHPRESANSDLWNRSDGSRI